MRERWMERKQEKLSRLLWCSSMLLPVWDPWLKKKKKQNQKKLQKFRIIYAFVCREVWRSDQQVAAGKIHKTERCCFQR